MKKPDTHPTFVFPDWEKTYEETDRNPNPQTFVPRDFEEGYVDDAAHSEALYQMAQLGPHAMDALLKDTVYGDNDIERKPNMSRVEIKGDAFIGAGLSVELLGESIARRIHRLKQLRQLRQNPEGRRGRSHFGGLNFHMTDPMFQAPRQSTSGQAFFTEIVGSDLDLVKQAAKASMMGAGHPTEILGDVFVGAGHPTEILGDDNDGTLRIVRRRGRKYQRHLPLTREDELRTSDMIGDEMGKKIKAKVVKALQAHFENPPVLDQKFGINDTVIFGDDRRGEWAAANAIHQATLPFLSRRSSKKASPVSTYNENSIAARGDYTPRSQPIDILGDAFVGAGHPTEILGDAFVGAGHPTEILGDLMDRGYYPTKIYAGGDSFIGSLALDLQKAANAGTLTTTSPVYLKLVKARGKAKADIAYKTALNKADARKRRLQAIAIKKQATTTKHTAALAKRAAQKIALSAKRKKAAVLRADAAKRRALAAAARGAARIIPKRPMVVRPPFANGRPQTPAVAISPSTPASADPTLPGLLQPPPSSDAAATAAAAREAAAYAPLQRAPGGGDPYAPPPDDEQYAAGATQSPPPDQSQPEPAADAPPEENTQEQEPSADSDPEAQDAAATAEEAAADANDAEASAEETTSDPNATEEDAQADTSGGWMEMVGAETVAARAAENSPTGKKIRAGMTVARRAKGGNRKAKIAISTMVKKTRTGDVQAKRDLTAIRAGHQANKQIAQAKRLFARKARSNSKTKRFELATLFKSRRTKAKERFNAAVKMQLCASKGDKNCLADIATVNTAAANNDPTAIRAQKNLLAAGMAIPLLTTPASTQKFYLYMKLAERARAGWAQPKERFNFLMAAARGGDPVGTDAATYFKVIIPILNLLDGKTEKVNATSMMGEAAIAKIPENVKYAARVLDAAHKGNNTARTRIKQMLRLAKRGNPQAIKQMGDMAAALAIADVRKGNAPDPGIVEASEIVARARAGEPEANRTIQRAHASAMKGDAQGVAAMTKLSAAATINKASPPAATPLPRKSGVVGKVQKFFNFYREGLRTSRSKISAMHGEAPPQDADVLKLENTLRASGWVFYKQMNISPNGLERLKVAVLRLFPSTPGVRNDKAEYTAQKLVNKWNANVIRKTPAIAAVQQPRAIRYR